MACYYSSCKTEEPWDLMDVQRAEPMTNHPLSRLLDSCPLADLHVAALVGGFDARGLVPGAAVIPCPLKAVEVT